MIAGVSCSRWKEKKWYVDSGCSRHMIGNKEYFITLEAKEGVVTFGDNDKGHIIESDKICITPIFIENVLLVDNLKHNILSISQLCDKGFKVVFESLMCIVTSPIDNSITLIEHRHRNVYIVDLDDHFTKKSQFLVAMNAKINKKSWLWHANMNLISKLIKKDLVKGLPKLDFEKDKICDACQFGKQIRNSFESKNIVSTSRPLELLHMNLFGPTRTTSLGGKKYGLVIIDDFSRFT